MRKVAFLLCIVALAFGALGSFAATKKVMYVPKTNSGKPIPKGFVKIQGHDPNGLVKFKAQNHLTAAMNQKLLMERAVHRSAYTNGTANTVPYFNGYFITGSRNSIYSYSMVGHSPSAGGTTSIDNQIIPLVTILQTGGVTQFVFDPTINNDPQGSDISLVAESPLYDATTTYPGPPAQTGQFTDSHQRVSFRTTAAASWHTPLNPPINSGNVWVQTLESNNGDWTLACGSFCFPVFNINTIFNNFEFILSVEAPANTIVPIIVTDYLTAFDPSSGDCCILGFHTADSNTDGNGPGIRAWTWGTYIPHSVTNPFGAFGEDTMVLSHEVDELFNDPFVNTNVAVWVDGSVQFAQGNLETGDVIEGMSAADVIYNVTLNPSGPYTYSLQNVANLEWFTRNPFNGGIYSWPNEHTLSQAPHPVGCTAGFPCWSYGQGSAGFFYGPPF